MSDDVFRIVVAAGVVVAALAFVVQAIVGIATLGAAKKMQQKLVALADRAEPVIDRIGPTVDKIGPVLERAVPVIDKAGAAIDKIGPTIERIAPVVEKFGPVAEKASELLTATQQIVQETRPQVSEISHQLVEITKSGREHVDRFGNLLNEAGDRARTRLEQIDATVGHTVEQVEQVSQNVKRAVTRPGREVNGIAAGVAAALNTLLRGPRRSSVDSATQDEEMFI